VKVLLSGVMCTLGVTLAVSLVACFTGAELGDEGVNVSSRHSLDSTWGGRVGDIGPARDIRASLVVDRDGEALVIACATDIRGVGEPAPGLVELGDEDIENAASIRRLESARSCGEVGGVRESGDVGAACAVDCDPEPIVFAAATQECGVGEPGPGVVELGDEGIVQAQEALVCALECPWSGGEGRGVGVAGDVGIASAIDSDGSTGVIERAAKVGRVAERRAGVVELGDEGVVAA